jgi:hypothetical protein
MIQRFTHSCCTKGLAMASIPSSGQMTTTAGPRQTTSPSRLKYSSFYYGHVCFPMKMVSTRSFVELMLNLGPLTNNVFISTKCNSNKDASSSYGKMLVYLVIILLLGKKSMLPSIFGQLVWVIGVSQVLDGVVQDQI